MTEIAKVSLAVSTHASNTISLLHEVGADLSSTKSKHKVHMLYPTRTRQYSDKLPKEYAMAIFTSTFETTNKGLICTIEAHMYPRNPISWKFEDRGERSWKSRVIINSMTYKNPQELITIVDLPFGPVVAYYPILESAPNHLIYK